VVYVKRRKVNEVLGDLIGIESGVDEVDVWAGFRINDPEEALGVLKFLREYCKVIKVDKSPHPLGRGTIVFSCPKIRVRVHGDWKPERNYVEIEKVVE